MFTKMHATQGIRGARFGQDKAIPVRRRLSSSGANLNRGHTGRGGPPPLCRTTDGLVMGAARLEELLEVTGLLLYRPRFGNFIHVAQHAR